MFFFLVQAIRERRFTQIFIECLKFQTFAHISGDGRAQPIELYSTGSLVNSQNLQLNF